MEQEIWTVEKLCMNLKNVPQDVMIQIESHCGTIDEMVGILFKNNKVILCNKEGYAQEELG